MAPIVVVWKVISPWSKLHCECQKFFYAIWNSWIPTSTTKNFDNRLIFLAKSWRSVYFRERCSDLGVWSMIPTDGAHCCGRSSKVQDLNYTATVDNCAMQFKICKSQLVPYKRIDNSLVLLAKKWKTMYFRSSKVCDSNPCFQCRFWGCSSDLSETISCQWSLEVYRTATKV